MRYDPHHPPNVSKWLAIPELERLDLVLDYHRRRRVRLPNEMLHAAIHVTIENQIAMADELPVESKLNQLMQEGLDRHEALHAIGSVLAEHVHGVLSDEAATDDPNARYVEALNQLTAQSWRQKYSE